MKKSKYRITTIDTYFALLHRYFKDLPGVYMALRGHEYDNDGIELLRFVCSRFPPMIEIHFQNSVI